MTCRNLRSGRLSHCWPSGRLNGKAKVVGSHRHSLAGFFFFLCLETTRTENAGSKRRGLFSTIRPNTGRPAKTCSGRRISSSRLRSTHRRDVSRNKNCRQHRRNHDVEQIIAGIQRRNGNHKGDQRVDDSCAGDVVIEVFSRRRSTATRRARYGTVTSPTRVASTREVEARMTVAQTLPASRETVENSAARTPGPAQPGREGI